MARCAQGLETGDSLDGLILAVQTLGDALRKIQSLEDDASRSRRQVADLDEELGLCRERTRLQRDAEGSLTGGSSLESAGGTRTDGGVGRPLAQC
jgi:hypothetical protein